ARNLRGDDRTEGRNRPALFLHATDRGAGSLHGQPARADAVHPAGRTPHLSSRCRFGISTGKGARGAGADGKARDVWEDRGDALKVAGNALRWRVAAKLLFHSYLGCASIRGEWLSQELRESIDAVDLPLFVSGEFLAVLAVGLQD